MDRDPNAHIVYFEFRQKFFDVRRLLDGASVTRVELGHTLRTGKSKGNMIVTIADSKPYSVIFINDWHRPAQQQLIEMGGDQPLRIDISPTQHQVAVLTHKGTKRLNPSMT